MVSREAGKCMLTNSESDSEAAPSLALEGKYTLDPSRQVRKRNKALQVRFKDICEAQNEQREAARQAGGKGGKPVSYKVAYRKYMTVPARRSIPNVTRSTGVQTSPDLKKRYQTFPFERKKGHTIKHAAAVESLKGHNNGFVTDAKGVRAGGSPGEPSRCGAGKASHKTRALLHTTECIATVEHHHVGGNCSDGDACADALLVSCSTEAQCTPGATAGPTPRAEAELQICSIKSRPRKGSHPAEADSDPSAKRQLLNFEEASTRTLRDSGSRVTGPIAWNSLTQVECLESPSSARGKRKKGLQLNGLQAQSQTLPRAGCSTQAQCHAPPPRVTGERVCTGEAPRARGAAGTGAGEACQQIVPVTQDGDLKAQLQVMENLISSSQETIKVLLGVIQELEKGEAHREGLSYRTGQDTANCDTCRNSACIIYSVELDFKLQEDKLQPLMKKLCPTEDPQFPSLPYPQEAFTSTPKRKSKTESKKHARWKLWFL
ncbi:inhibitory synaptic factor 2A [Megalops cyprinoides]|uniref:inhibitory synaptic factor 2A n=1 Tax=Megalops cyprinoides TaxID=118141 RepID=UPI001863B0EE|nr:inhibitory synaptic factor 2A [Megalops cyprinoides]